MIAQAAHLWSLSTLKVKDPHHHRSDCPYSLPWWRQDVVVPAPVDCPHCIWSRVYAFNVRYAVVGWAILSVAILTLVAYMAV